MITQYTQAFMDDRNRLIYDMINIMITTHMDYFLYKVILWNSEWFETVKISEYTIQ